MADRYLKQVIVVRRDLSMPALKLAAMVAHAAMTFLLARMKTVDDEIASGLTLVRKALTVTPDEDRWLTELDPGIEETGQVSMAKIAVYANDEAHLLEIEANARAAGLSVHRVIDSGYAHNKRGTFVAIAVGPDWPEKLDPVTGSLKTR